MTYTRAEAVALGHPTFVLGPSQVSIQQTPMGVYVLNWITDPQERGQGHAGAVFQAMVVLADLADITLVTHADTPELQSTMERYGFVSTEAHYWEDKPLLRRSPVDTEEPRNPDLEMVNIP